MKISTLRTLNKPIMREKPIALPRDVIEFCEEIEQELREDYILSHFSLLQRLSPELESVTVCGNFVLFQYADAVAYTVITKDMTRQKITEILIRAVKRGE